MSLAAGKLRHQVSIERQVSERDSDGVLQVFWEPVATVWAGIEPISAREFIQSGAVQSQLTTRITIRYRADVQAAMRVLHKGKVFNIAGVLADKDSGVEYLTLPCSEGVNDGQ